MVVLSPTSSLSSSSASFFSSFCSSIFASKSSISTYTTTIITHKIGWVNIQENVESLTEIWNEHSCPEQDAQTHCYILGNFKVSKLWNRTDRQDDIPAFHFPGISIFITSCEVEYNDLSWWLSVSNGYRLLGFLLKTFSKYFFNHIKHGIIQISKCKTGYSKKSEESLAQKSSNANGE